MGARGQAPSRCTCGLQGSTAVGFLLDRREECSHLIGPLKMRNSVRTFAVVFLHPADVVRRRKHPSAPTRAHQPVGRHVRVSARLGQKD